MKKFFLIRTFFVLCAFIFIGLCNKTLAMHYEINENTLTVVSEGDNDTQLNCDELKAQIPANNLQKIAVLNIEGPKCFKISDTNTDDNIYTEANVCEDCHNKYMDNIRHNVKRCFLEKFENNIDRANKLYDEYTFLKEVYGKNSDICIKFFNKYIVLNNQDFFSDNLHNQMMGIKRNKKTLEDRRLEIIKNNDLLNGIQNLKRWRVNNCSCETIHEKILLPNLVEIRSNSLEKIEGNNGGLMGSHLVKVSCPNLKTIPDYCFKNCRSLANINCGCLEYIGESAIYNCDMLGETLEFPELLVCKDENFVSCPNIRNIVFEKLPKLEYHSLCGLTDCQIKAPNLKVIGEECLEICQNTKIYNEKREDWDSKNTIFTIDKFTLLGKETDKMRTCRNIISGYLSFDNISKFYEPYVKPDLPNVLRVKSLAKNNIPLDILHIQNQYQADHNLFSCVIDNPPEQVEFHILSDNSDDSDDYSDFTEDIVMENISKLVIYNDSPENITTNFPQLAGSEKMKKLYNRRLVYIKSLKPTPVKKYQGIIISEPVSRELSFSEPE